MNKERCAHEFETIYEYGSRTQKYDWVKVEWCGKCGMVLKQIKEANSDEICAEFRKKKSSLIARFFRLD